MGALWTTIGGSMPIDFKRLTEEMERERADPEYKAQKEEQRRLRQAQQKSPMQRRTEQRRQSEMNGTQTNTTEEAFDDLDILVPAAGDDYQETIPAGMYSARLIKFKRVPKPDWKLKGDEETDDDRHQFEWGFQITGGDYDGIKLNDYTNISWHEKATAHKHAAALLGVPALTPDVALSTRALAGKPCQLWVVEKPTKKDPAVFRNWIDKVVSIPAPRPRPQRPPQPSQAPPVQLKGYPPPDGDAEFWDVIPEPTA
jgi:cation diffusion facilitator CzcD-associated flavoprotein CzcO